jgi:hypothetical protein
MSAHSPGPWQWEPGDPTIESPSGGLICTIAQHANIRTAMHTGEGFNSADARLIAAAPELLTLLREYVVGDFEGEFHGQEMGTGIRPRARALIARVEGKP